MLIAREIYLSGSLRSGLFARGGEDDEHHQTGQRKQDQERDAIREMVRAGRLHRADPSSVCPRFLQVGARVHESFEGWEKRTNRILFVISRFQISERYMLT